MSIDEKNRQGGEGRQRRQGAQLSNIKFGKLLVIPEELHPYSESAYGATGCKHKLKKP
jgi:hypothetical protein